MGVDVCHKKNRKVRRTESKSQDIYLRLLVKIYRFLARGPEDKFNKIILKRLFMINRPPLSIARLARNLKKPVGADKTVVVVGTVTNDLRIFDIPILNNIPDREYSKFKNSLIASYLSYCDL